MQERLFQRVTIDVYPRDSQVPPGMFIIALDTGIEMRHHSDAQWAVSRADTKREVLAEVSRTALARLIAEGAAWLSYVPDAISGEENS